MTRPTEAGPQPVERSDPRDFATHPLTSSPRAGEAEGGVRRDVERLATAIASSDWTDNETYIEPTNMDRRRAERILMWLDRLASPEPDEEAR
jgi:hypothetical protein